ncbi:acyltransferase [Bacillus sp. RO1]|uniref:acyltransferase family protein n=1 Tax=Bacillus sp. RO1 TaxID=2722703 RepID=UPI001456BF84|nr:acyltransferase [Bacillus sp. RO1]NLP51821.1 acyltransferase [Bacillus sp. RO1]
MKRVKTQQLHLIQLLRAVAILFVMLGHLNGLLFKRYAQDWFGMGEWGRTGGVDMFFVISGFMIAYLYKHKIGESGHAGTFLLKRITRIIPYYWLTTFGVLSILLIFPYFGEQFSLSYVIQSLFLLSDDPILTVAWSLKHIFFFYLMFTLLLFKPAIGRLTIATYLTTIITCYFIDFYPENILVATMLNVSNLTIWLGAIVAFSLTSSRVNINHLIGGALTIIGIAAFLLIWTNNTYQFLNIEEGTIRPLLYGISSCFLVAGLGSIDLNQKTKVNKLLDYIGKASFSIFLTHSLFLMLFIILFIENAKIQEVIGWDLTMVAILLLATTGGLLAYQFVEKPLNKRLNTLLNHNKMHHHSTVRAKKIS